MNETAAGQEERRERRPGVQVISKTLREGESFSGFFFMKEGSLYGVTIEGWESIDALIMSLSDGSGGMVGPEIDETGTVVCFRPPRNDLYEMTIVLSALAGGEGSVEVKAVATEMKGLPDDPSWVPRLSARNGRCGGHHCGHFYRAQGRGRPGSRCLLEGADYGAEPFVSKPLGAG